MSEPRKIMVSKTYYNYLDPKRTNAVSLFELKSKYNPKGHPDVINGIRTEDDVLLDFLETFEAYHEFSAGVPKRETVSFKEFQGYYSYMNFLFSNDQEFKAQDRKSVV